MIKIKKEMLRKKAGRRIIMLTLCNKLFKQEKKILDLHRKLFDVCLAVSWVTKFSEFGLEMLRKPT